MSRVGFGLAIAALAAIAAWMAITGKLQAIVAAAKSSGAQPPAGALPNNGSTGAGAPDPGSAAGGASGSWATPTVPAPMNTPTPAPASSPAAKTMSINGVSIAVPSTFPVIDFSKLITYGTDGVKATPYVPPQATAA